MYEIPSEKYQMIGEDCETVFVNYVNKVSRFLLKSETELEERPAGLPAEAYAVPLPEYSTRQMKKNIVDDEHGIEAIDKKIFAEKKFRTALLDYKKQLASDIEFENCTAAWNQNLQMKILMARKRNLLGLQGIFQLTQ